MNNLESVLMEVYRLEFAEYNNLPKHHFSRRYRKEMKKILYPKKQQKTSDNINRTYIPIRKRIMLFLLIIILMTVSVTAGAAAIRGFERVVYRDNTQLFAADTENCPKKLESVCYLASIPNGYDLDEENTISTPLFSLTSYINPNTGKTFSFEQWTKDRYATHFDNEHGDFEEVDLDGYYALYFDFSGGQQNSGALVWDSGDYILEINGDFSKKR